MHRALLLLALLAGCSTSSTTDTPGDDLSNGDPAAHGDAHQGDAHAGDPHGDPIAGDAHAGDPHNGDPSAGDPHNGDPNTGDPSAGDPHDGDPRAGDPNATCDIKCAPDPVYAMVECVSFSDGTTSIDLVRKTLHAICAGGCNMEPVSLWIQRPDRSDCFTDADAIRYTNTHHNWQDSVSVCADDICYQLDTMVDFSGPSMLYDGVLTGTTPDTTDVIFGPLDVPGVDRIVHF